MSCSPGVAQPLRVEPLQQHAGAPGSCQQLAVKGTARYACVYKSTTSPACCFHSVISTDFGGGHTGVALGGTWLRAVISPFRRVLTS